MERKARPAFKACCGSPVARLAEPKLTRCCAGSQVMAGFLDRNPGFKVPGPRLEACRGYGI